MAALQSRTEGHPPKPPSRSFLDILSSQTAGILRPRSTNTYRGYPSIAFSAEDISDFSAPFRHALIGKFSSGRPPMESIRKAFISIGFAGSYSLGLIDYRHILIKFNIEEDYVRAFLKRIYTIDGFTMRLFKWSTDFSVDSESAILPIWVNFPLLPLHFFNKEALYNIARLIGEPLKMDASTAALTRPSVARVCVELDLRKVRPEKIWLVNGGTGIWQPVDYEKVPPLCSKCFKIGHQAEACRSVDSRPKHSSAAEPSIPSLSQKVRMEYRPKVAAAPILNSIADKEKETLLLHPSKAAVTDVATTNFLKIQNFSLNIADSDVPSVSVAGAKAAQSGMSAIDAAVIQHPSPLVKNPDLPLFPTVVAAAKMDESKKSCSTECSAENGPEAAPFPSATDADAKVDDAVCLELGAEAAVFASISEPAKMPSAPNEYRPTGAQGRLGKSADVVAAASVVQMLSANTNCEFQSNAEQVQVTYAETLGKKNSVLGESSSEAFDANCFSDDVVNPILDDLEFLAPDLLAVNHSFGATPSLIHSCQEDIDVTHRAELFDQDSVLTEKLARNELVSGFIDGNSSDQVSLALPVRDEIMLSNYSTPPSSGPAKVIPSLEIVPFVFDGHNIMEAVVTTTIDAHASLSNNGTQKNSEVPVPTPTASISKEPFTRAELDDLLKNLRSVPIPRPPPPATRNKSPLPSADFIPAPKFVDVAPITVLAPETSQTADSSDFDSEEHLCYDEDLEVQSSYFQPLALTRGRGKTKEQIQSDRILRPRKKH